MEDVLSRAESLARHSDSPDHYTRTWLTPAHQAAARQIAAWMEEAGMEVRVDAVGSVIGRYTSPRPPAQQAEPAPAIIKPGGRGPMQREKTLLLGSHFDSVRNGGKYDGVLGILIPIACVAELNRLGERLRYAIEIAAFSDEEGARFQTSFLASKAMVRGAEAMAPLLERRDADGVTVAEAMRAAGLDPARTEEARIDPASLAGYVEVHIEQGPVLLDAGVPLGVVTSIASGSRHLVRVTGEAGHAGTVPMKMRHDALAAAAEMVLAVEEEAARDGVGTVGLLEVTDGTGNVIPGEVEFTLDLRAPEDQRRTRLEERVLERFNSIAARRGVTVRADRRHDVKSAPCALGLQVQLGASVERVGATPMRLASGAGHDAMVLAEVTDVGMLFVRCGAGGVSHNPAETVTAEDVELAERALLDFLRRFRAPA
jgi:hydantoinase/carbamoylase family amidase